MTASERVSEEECELACSYFHNYGLAKDCISRLLAERNALEARLAEAEKVSRWLQRQREEEHFRMEAIDKQRHIERLQSEATIKHLMDPIVREKACQAPPPMVLTGVPHHEVERRLAAARAEFAREALAMWDAEDGPQDVGAFLRWLRAVANGEER